MESADKIKKAIITFVILTFALSSIFYVYFGLVGSLEVGGGIYILILMWCPAISAIITSLIFYRSIREFGWKPGKVKYLIGGYAIPLIYATIGYGLFWILSSGSFTGRFPENMTYFVIMGTFSSIIMVLGEEIGWRGFLVPQLAKITSFTKLSIITGVIWAVWHYPLIIFAGYNAGVPLWYSLLMVTISVIATSFIYAWFRLKSGSIWPTVMLHASHDLYVESFFDPLTLQTGITRYIVGETGMILAGLILAFAFILWKMRDRLPDKRINKP